MTNIPSVRGTPAALAAGYGPMDIPMEPSPSAYRMEMHEGQVAYGRALGRWIAYSLFIERGDLTPLTLEVDPA